MLLPFVLLLQVSMFEGQPATARRVLAVEVSRLHDTTDLVEATKSSDVNVQRLAARAIGRLERPELRDLVLPLMKSADTTVRMAAANALGQMNASADYEGLLKAETSARARAELYTSLGRVKPAVAGAEQRLSAGLQGVRTVGTIGVQLGGWSHFFARIAE